MNQTNYNPDVLTCLANLSNDEVFTPPSMVNQMLDMLPSEIWSDKNAKFLDPVTKTGVFLREIAKRLIDGLEDEIPDLQERLNHIYQNQVYGIAITELTSLLSRRSLYCSKTANGKYSISDTFSDEKGNIIYDKIEHTWQGGNCKFCGASKANYDRESTLETHAYQFIHTLKPEEIFNMKFDVIIGNPPYQLSDGGNSASASPIYQLFVEQAIKMNPRFLTMIIPSRWFAGGKGLDNFRNAMLNDNHIRKITDYLNAKECFPGTSIGGGVCYFLWDRDNGGLCEFTQTLNGKANTKIRRLNQFSTFVRFNEGIQVIERVLKHDEKSLSLMVSSRNPFGLSSSTRGTSESFNNSISLYSSQGLSYIKQSDILDRGNVNNYKVMVSKVTSEHAGEPDNNGMFKILSRIQILNPNEVCTDSYLTIGNFNKKNPAENMLNYLKTRFVRFLLLQAVTSINLSKDKFFFIPVQDFQTTWTDEKLYKKYGLTEDEIQFIESLIRPMD